MPIYEYKCLDCGRVNEFLIVSNREEKLVCKYCGSEKLEKLFSSATFLKSGVNRKGRTCCGREERCSTPPCAGDGVCRRH